MSKVSRLGFDTAEFPPAERLACYRAVVPHYDVMQPEGASPLEFEVQAVAWMLGDFVVSSSRLSPVRYVRSAEKAKADGRNSFVVLLLRRGGWSGDLDGQMLTVGPGQAVMFDLTRPFDAASLGASDSISLDVARATLAGAAPADVDLHGLVFDGAAGRMLADQMMLLLRRLPGMEQDEVPDAVGATLGLLRGCLAVATQPREQGMALRDVGLLHRANRYIDENIGDRSLSIARLCRDLGVSRSALYRAFAPLSGVADHIRSRRLEAIHLLLEDDSVDRWNAEIAAEFGFVSEAHFSRSVRQRYGYTPRQAGNGDNPFRDLAAVANKDAAADVFDAWIAHLQSNVGPAVRA